MDTAVGLLRGMGSSVLPMAVSLLGVCGFRMVWILWIFPMHHTLEMLIMSYPISWGATFAVAVGLFLWLTRPKNAAKITAENETE